MAQRLQQTFQRAGWTAPSVERVAENYGGSVRYYFADDEAKAAKAFRVTQEFAKSLPGASGVRLVSLVGKSLEGKVPHGQLKYGLAPAPATRRLSAAIDKLTGWELKNRCPLAGFQTRCRSGI